MLKLLGNALRSMVMEKDARKKLEERRKAGPGPKRGTQVDTPERPPRQAMTPERQELIRQAMEVQRAQSKILDDLGDEDKQRLHALALKHLLGKQPDADDEKK